MAATVGENRPRVSAGRSGFLWGRHGDPESFATKRRNRLIKYKSLPRLADYPIPIDTKPDATWTSQMIELADHIGPYATLLLVEHFGGQIMYFPQPQNAAGHVLSALLGVDVAQRLCFVYQMNRVQIPCGRASLDRARRSGILAAVRAKILTQRDAAIIIGTSATYVSNLVHGTSEGLGVTPSAMPERREAALLRRAGDAVAATLSAAAVAPAIIVTAVAAVTDIDPFLLPGECDE